MHISISGTAYARLKAYATDHNQSLAAIVERAVALDLGLEPPPPRPARRYRGGSNG
jgi:hypothetical protein